MARVGERVKLAAALLLLDDWRAMRNFTQRA
jgi:hypothetical protein